MKLLICYLTSAQRHYSFKPFLHFLLQSQRKHEWTLLVMTNDDDGGFYNELLAPLELNSAVLQVDNTGGNYLDKVRSAALIAQQNQVPYLMKCDNDLFFSGETLDFMLEHLDSTLQSDKHLTLSPVLTNGIPTVEYFVRDFMDPVAQIGLRRQFMDTVFYARDGADYTPLNEWTSESTSGEWNPDAFFDAVRRLPTYYKGVHPVRFNPEANHFINQYVVSHKHAFFERKPTGLIVDNDSPYLCDSVFCIRTDRYLTILDDQSAFVDGFDEVPLNKYAEKHGMNHVFVENGYALHMMYNWVGNHTEYERRLCDQLFQ